MAENGYYYSINDFPGDGVQTTFEISFAGGYISRSHISGRLFRDSDKSFVDVAFTWINDYTIRMSSPPQKGYTLRVYRTTPIAAPLVDYSDGALLSEINLDTANRQAIFAAQEAVDAFGTVPGNDTLRDTLAALIAATNRANHTGTQAISTIVGLSDALAGKLSSDALSGDAGAALIKWKSAGTGAIARTLADELSDTFVNVKRFGAVGNGVADDSTAIQKAIDYVFNRGGGTVYMPAGKYMLGMQFSSSPFFGFFAIQLRTGVRLIGEDQFGTYLKIKDNIPNVGPGAPFVPILGQYNMRNVTVENFTIDGNRAAQPGLDPTNPSNQPPSNGGTILIGCYDNQPISNIRIARIRSMNAYGQGIQVFGQNSQQGNNVVVEDCSVYNAGYIGIQVSRANNVDISGNYVEGSGDNAIDVYGDSNTAQGAMRDVVITRNRMLNCLRGIFPETVCYCIMSNNTIDGSDEGIHLNQIVSATHNISITGNMIRNTRAPTVFSGAFNSVLVTGNVINNFTYGAFAIGFNQGQCSGVTFGTNQVWPATNTTPIYIIPGGTQFLSYVEFGQTYLTERDTGNPSAPSTFLSGSAAFTNLTSYPAVLSMTNPGQNKPEMYLDYGYLNRNQLNKPRFTGISAANNAGAVSAGGVQSEFYYNTTIGALSVVQ